MRLEAHNIDALARQLAQDLAPAVQAGAMGIAAALQDVIAPYPSPPSGSVYRRGSDPRSEQMNQRWRIRPIPSGAVLENTASYSRWVHGSPKENPGQTKVHKQTGWVNEDEAIKEIDPAPIMEQALRERLEVMG